MKLSILGYFTIGLFTLLVSSCGIDNGSEVPVDRSTLKIALVDSLVLEEKDGTYYLTEDLRELCAVLIPDAKNCSRTYILDPTILRLDLQKEFSLKTTIEKGGAKNVNNPKVIGKLINKNFDQLEIPKEFSKATQTVVSTDLIESYVNSKASKDSILVFSTDESKDIYIVNKTKYRVFSSIESLRNKILSILCEDTKANFTLLINPPVIKDPVIIKDPPIKTEEPKGPRTGPKEGRKKGGTVNKSKPNGVLNIIKGSEGCDVCTRYYSATDNNGFIHEVRERNSTNCCPCGKTVKMNGLTYIMNCEGAPHLEPVN
ncbi:hypothetical protein [Fibrivirga algicola]|uniref:Uncharacterized protein n=1 Tax=Fibrivirga algicola TaxID=2950420 RepID=A0ABX0QCT1_9BACT|nr:hypothetical protein [Fibrivirga algicola]NID10211.1 hypothetical protein [Fibrivirga algicola]